MPRKQERQINKVLLQLEIREAEDEVVRSCQREAFVNDYKAWEANVAKSPPVSYTHLTLPTSDLV